MKTGFKDPIAIKKQDPKDHPVDGKKTPWDFRCPQYDQRSSCFINAGTHYGIAHKQPVGHSENPRSDGVIPKGRVNTMRTDEEG
jgi:hypothetical protein